MCSSMNSFRPDFYLWPQFYWNNSIFARIKDMSCMKVTHRNYLHSWYTIFTLCVRCNSCMLIFITIFSELWFWRGLVINSDSYLAANQIQAPWLTTVSQTEWPYCKYKIFDQLMGLASVKNYSACVMLHY